MKKSMVKSERLLVLYSRLASGGVLSKKELAQEFGVAERSIQRDVESLRCFFADQGIQQDVVLDRASGGYRLKDTGMASFSDAEMLVVCQILLQSQGLAREEMLPILDKLLTRCLPRESSRELSRLLASERLRYQVSARHKPILDLLWRIVLAVQNRQMLEIVYERNEALPMKRLAEPLGILFVEQAFYLAAYLHEPEQLSPAAIRLDCIRSCRMLSERFHTSYREQFDEEKFRTLAMENSAGY